MSADVPLTPEYLFEALQAASSQSQELVQNASAQLKTWERHAGYWSMLQDMFLNRSLPVEIRWLSIITLKQGVDKYWRKTANNSITKAEKTHLRSRLISSATTEPVPQLALQNAVIIGKVARLEYPLDWPDVFTELTAIIRSSTTSSTSTAAPEQTQRLTRALSVLLHVVKELATGRLTRTKANLQSVAPEVFRVLGGVYVQHVEAWHEGLPVPSMRQRDDVTAGMTISLLCLKILRRLIVAGYEFPNRAGEVQELWQILCAQVWALLAAEERTGQDMMGQDGGLAALVRKHVVNVGKLFLDVASSHPAAFALFPGTLGLLGKYWEVVVAYGESLVGKEQESEERRVFREKVALQGMLLFRSCAKMIFSPVSTFKYRHKTEKDENREATEIFKTQLFTPQTVTHCMEILVTKYFILRPADLTAWTDDPEAWSEQWENAIESWEFLLRPCAEKLFLDLVTNFKDVLAAPLMRVFNGLAAAENNDVLTKDAIYTAVGLAAPVLHISMDFDAFLHSTLVPEIQVQAQGYNILRRRIAILISQWVPVKMSAESRPTVYQVTQHLLNREDPLNDLVVRLTAARCLRCSVLEWEFKVDPFVPFVEVLFSRLMALIDEVEQTETRMGLLNVIGVVVERLEHRIAPYAEGIVRILPPLWEQTGDEHLFKQAILQILTKLVAAMGERSVRYQEMVVGLVRYSVEPGSGMQVYLLEDALELWEATLRTTPAPAPQALIDLIPFLLPCVELGTLTLRKVLTLLESYVLLAPAAVIEHYRTPLFSAFAALLSGSLKPEATGIVTGVLEIVIRGAQALGALDVVGAEIVRCGLLGVLMDGIAKSKEANETTGPNRRYSPIEAVVMTDYFDVLARMVLAGTDWWGECVGRVAEGRGRDEGVKGVMTWVLDEWFRHFGNIGHPKERKLNCIALTKLLETNQEWILVRLQDLMTVWTDVVNEFRENQGGDALIYWVQPEDDTEAPATPESSRRKELTQSDPVHAVDVVEFIQHHLRKAQSENGGPDRFAREWVANVDKDVLQDFAKLGIV